MRPELRDLSEDQYWVYGVKESDIPYTLELVQDFIETSQEDLSRKIGEIQARDEDEQTVAEIESDVAHYTWVNEQYLWQFCLWRLQGIFEALIVYTYLPNEKGRRLPGLKAKLNAAKAAGFLLSEADEKELLRWNNLRNAVSHAPPEQYRPIPFEEDDLKEYAALLHRVLGRWTK